MQDFGAAFGLAFRLIISGDPDLAEIVLLSLQVSLSAVFVACLLGLPIGAAVAIARFPGRGLVIVVLNALMGLPPVVVGLFIYLLLSNAGPLGDLGLLYTVTAMIIHTECRDRCLWRDHQRFRAPARSVHHLARTVSVGQANRGSRPASHSYRWPVRV